MIGIPQWTTWPWVFISLVLVIIVMRSLLHSEQDARLSQYARTSERPELVGVDVATSKVLAFVIGSVFAGLAGGFVHTIWLSFIPRTSTSSSRSTR